MAEVRGETVSRRDRQRADTVREIKETARRLLVEQGVAVMPGSALGAGGEGFFRIALTVPEERLREAAHRIGQLLHAST